MHPTARGAAFVEAMVANLQTEQAQPGIRDQICKCDSEIVFEAVAGDAACQ